MFRGGDHFLTLYYHLQTKTKTIPIGVVEDDEGCNQAASVIMANAETVIGNLKNEVEMREQFTNWTANRVLAPKLTGLLERMTTPPRTVVTSDMAPSSASPSLLSTPASRSSILKSRVNTVPHNNIPEMEGGSSGKEYGDGTILQFNGEGQGGGGHSCLLSVRIKVVEDLSSCDNLRAGLALVHERLDKVLLQFSLLIVKKVKALRCQVQTTQSGRFPGHRLTIIYSQRTSFLPGDTTLEGRGGKAKVRLLNQRNKRRCSGSSMTTQGMRDLTCLRLMSG